MNELIDVKSLMRVSTFAGLIKKSAARVHQLADKNKIDIIAIDGVHFVRVNDKFRKFVK